jgi:SulP family sulfate permease
MAGVGLIESLLTLNIIDEITETRGRGNKEIAQGVANILSGFFWYGWLRYVGTKPY